MRRSIFASLLLLYLILRWVLGTDPGYTFDVQAYKRWAMAAATYGIARVYETSDCDYPPVYVYYLYPLGKVYAAIHPFDEETGGYPDGPLLTFVVKLPPLLMDFALAGLLFWLTRRVGSAWTRAPGGSGPSGEAPEAAGGRDGQVSGPMNPPPSWVFPAIYLLNPGVVFDTGYWGQPDSIHSFLILASFVALGGRRAWLPWTLLTLAALMKPLGAPFFPLLAVISLAYHGLRGTIAGGVAAAVTALVVFLPFLAAGQMEATFHRVIGDVGAMAYTSTNAHNLWWVLGPWQDSEVARYGPFTATQVALALFGLLYASVLYRAHRLHRSSPGGLSHPQALAFAFVIAIGFFMLSTHMHENHLFMSVPLAAALLTVGGAWQKRMRWLFAGVSLGLLLNLVLHDLHLPEQPPLSWGGAIDVENPHLRRPFFATELALIRISTGLNLLLFAVTLVWTFRRGWLESMSGLPRLRDV